MGFWFTSLLVGLKYPLTKVTLGASDDRLGHWLEVTALSQQADKL